MSGVARTGCPVITELTVQELGHLNRIERPDNELQPINWCSLEAAHEGTWHYAAVQQAGAGEDRQEWWLRWNDHSREVVILPGCDASGPAPRPDDDPDSCLLFDGHPGNHDFDRAPIDSALDWQPQLTVGQLRAALARLADDTTVRLAAADTGVLAGTGEAVLVGTLLGATEVRGGPEQRRRPVSTRALVLIADQAGTPREDKS